MCQQMRQPDRVMASGRYAPASHYAAGYANVRSNKDNLDEH